MYRNRITNLSVSKTFRSLVLSTDLIHARFHYKTREGFFHVCLKLPDRPHPTWFTNWIKPDQILTNDLDNKKLKSTLVQVPSSYTSQEPWLFGTVGSDIYAFKQYNSPSRVMLVRNKESFLWRNAPNMISSRVYPVACVLDGTIYVMGGSTEANWGEVCDTKTQTWEPLPNPSPELCFSSVIRKVDIIEGKIYITSNDDKDSVYDPKEGTWNVVGKVLMNESMCMVDNILYFCSQKSCLWYDTEGQEWRQVKGLSLLNKSGRRGLIETDKYGRKLLILWDKFAQPRRNCPDKSICCALVSLEKRQNGQVWGHVEWSNVVLRVPSSYYFCVLHRYWFDQLVVFFFFDIREWLLDLFLKTLHSLE